MSQDPPRRGGRSKYSQSRLNRAAREYRQGRDQQKNRELICSGCQGPLANHFARKRVPAPDREDLVQETLLRLCHSLDDFRGESSVLTYACRIADNVLKRWLRQRGKNPVALSLVEDDSREREIEDPGDSPEDQVVHDQRRSLIAREIEKLPPRMQACLRLRIYQNLSYEDIAAILDIKVSTVGVTLRNAKNRLNKALSRGVDKDRRDSDDERNAGWIKPAEVAEVDDD